MASQLVLISIDGLMPTWYLDGGQLPSLCRWLSRSTHAERVEPVYPTVTMACHASIATGCQPDRHGIVANTRFEPDAVRHWRGGESQDWHFDATDVQVPALWDVARDHGRSTALLRWPITRGAHADWLIPEIFLVGDDDPDATWALLKQHTTPALVPVMERLWPRPPHNHEAYDRFTTQLAIHLLKHERPDLLMLHLNAIDHEVHEHGFHGNAVTEALINTDSCIRALLAAIDLRRSTVFIFGDHGFMEFDKRIHINALLAEHGWLTVEDGRIVAWEAIAHTNCAQAPVYLKTPSRREALLQLLRAHAPQQYQVLARPELDRWHTQPGAIAAIDALPGYSLGQNLSGPLITDVGKTRGEHGYLPTHPSIHTGFLAIGRHIPQGLRLPAMSVCDIAPTAAGLMKLPMPNVDGQPIPLGVLAA